MSFSGFVNRVLTNTSKKRLKLLRAGLFEAIGSDRYSHPPIHGIEKKIAEYIPEREGMFVECGANDGYSQSNTYHLERLQNWKGVLIEPVPSLAKLCRATRKNALVFNCALGANNDENCSIIYSDLMTTTVGAHGSREGDERYAAKNKAFVQRDGNYEIKVPMRTLSAVLDEAGVNDVDFFSLDVEGFEIEVLKGLDRSRYRIGALLVETHHIDAISKMLAGTHVLAAKITHHDYMFVSNSRKGII
jgi:FkbM family methyltransferase